MLHAPADDPARRWRLRPQADVTFVGIGDLGPEAPLFIDGFITQAELKALQKAGAVGEIVGWAFDREGKLIDGITNDRVASSRRCRRAKRQPGGGDSPWARRKLPGIHAALDAPAGQWPDHRRAHRRGAAAGLDHNPMPS